MEKVHSSEYLLEMSQSCDAWLKTLIVETVKTNGNVSEERYIEIFNHLAYGEHLEISNVIYSPELSNIEIKINRLEHICGVNALANNQCIKFSENVTVLHGLNGAGKSSYFKVLNELVGGIKQKKILSNIYSSETKPIEVNVEYSVGGSKISFTWDGNSRDVQPLNISKVFDTSYLESFLKKRLIDDSVIEPLGLHLFSYLATQVDRLKSDLTVVAKDYLKSKPEIEKSDLSDEIKAILGDNKITNEDQLRIERMYTFGEDEVKKLNTLLEEIRCLEQVNYEDKVKVENNKVAKLNSLVSELKQNYNNLCNNSKLLNSLIDSHQKYAILSAEFKKNTEQLSNLPATNTSTWKSFIEASQAYSKQVRDSGQICIYCRQPLDSNAVRLIGAYNMFLENESEKELRSIVSKIELLKKEVTKIVIREISETELKELERTFDNQEEITLFLQRISNLKREMITFKDELINNIEAKSKNVYPQSKIEVDKWVNWLNIFIESFEEKIETIKLESTTKEERLLKLLNEKKSLKEHKSISVQSEKLKEWFELHHKYNHTMKITNSLKTNQITRVSIKANDKLLTENLAICFKEELEKLGLNLEVTLEKAGSTKGKALSELRIKKNCELTSILSEGEQKASALALFLAEVRTQNICVPIILDDPVNSLDHKIAEKFADSLLGLNNQVIIFNHNRLFLDAFETTQEHHICKTIDSDCNKLDKGKHIRIYEVRSEGRKAKGVLSNYKSRKAKNLLKDASRLLGRSPFEEEMKVAILIRRAVESVIDENILKNFTPTRYSNKNTRISWDNLKLINIDSDEVEKLHQIHSRVSGSELHNGTENLENPIDKDEYECYVEYLYSFIS